MLADILKRANDFYSRCLQTGGSVPWFRGHARADWKLKSSLHRDVEDRVRRFSVPRNAANMRAILRSQYQSTYKLFLHSASPLLTDLQRSEWGVICVMQHHGIPTRLLDWTESFLCALYFAQRERIKNKPAAIWALDPQAMNEVAGLPRQMVGLDVLTKDPQGKSEFDSRPWHPLYKSAAESGKFFIPSIAVTMPYTNPRMTAQRSVFTVMGDRFLPLDKEFGGRLMKEGHLIKIELGPDTYEETEEFLRLAGGSAFAFFPDLDGIAQQRKADGQAEIMNAMKFFPQHLKPKRKRP